MKYYHSLILIGGLIGFMHSEASDQNVNPQTLGHDHLQQLKTMSERDVNGYVTSRPAQSRYLDRAQSLDGAASQHAVTNDHAQILLESAHKRPFFALDPHKDSLITQGDEAISHPEQTIRTATEYQYTAPEYTDHVCEESKPTFQVECTKTLNVAVISLKQRIYLYTHYHGWSGNYYSFTTSEPYFKDDEVHRRWDGCNWWHNEVNNIYRYEIQEVEFDSQQGTSKAGVWKEITKEQWNKIPDDSLHDEWIDSCGYLKDEGAKR